MTYEAHFYSEHCKVTVDSRNAKKKKKKKMRQKIDVFSDNLIEVDHSKFSLLIREYS